MRLILVHHWNLFLTLELDIGASVPFNVLAAGHGFRVSGYQSRVCLCLRSVVC